MTGRFWLTLLACWLTLSTADAQVLVEAPADGRALSLLPALEFFIDEEDRWRPEAKLPPPVPWRPLMQRAGRDNFGFFPEPFWLRVSLRAATSGDWVWVLPRGQWDHLTWVVEREGRVPQRAIAGLGPIETGEVAPHRVPSVSIRLAAGETVTVYLRVQTTGRLRVNAELQEAAAWRHAEERRRMWLGMYFGLLGGLLIYNGFLALRLRDTAYRFYIGFGASMGMFQLATTGFGPFVVWPTHALWTYWIVALMALSLLINSLMFTDSFLRVRRFSRGLSWTLRGASLLGLVWWLLELFAMSTGLLPWAKVVKATIVPVVSCFPLILVAGVWGWLRGAWSAGIFVLAWGGVATAMIVYTLMSLGILPVANWTYDTLLIASAAEMLLLSLALADRVTAERHARAEADLQRAREQTARENAQQALREKSRFMAAVTHDLQQPLYALSLATESVARQGQKPMPPQALAQIRSAVHTADELLGSLAMNVRLERAELQPEFGTFSVQDMLERIEVLFDARAQQAGLRWRVLPCLATVHSDPVMLERMVCNLVSNALRYTSRGGVLLSCRIRADHLLLQVWDTGAGIAVHEQGSIFEAYQRGSAALVHDRGLGLGLSIVHRCARLLDIRVGLRSVPGRGSCFALWVPLAQPYG